MYKLRLKQSAKASFKEIKGKIITKNKTTLVDMTFSELNDYLSKERDTVSVGFAEGEIDSVANDIDGPVEPPKLTREELEKQFKARDFTKDNLNDYAATCGYADEITTSMSKKSMIKKILNFLFPKSD